MAASTGSSKRIFAPAGGDSTTHQAEQYLKGELHRPELNPDPFAQFHQWFSEAQSQGVHQPETVCLSTATLPTGAPSSRFVYLKELDDQGFVIYSNWDTSRKAEDIESNPQASLAFWWHEVQRQVRVEGDTERLSQEESQAYYSLRVRGSKIGAWASEQSKVLGDDTDGRENLDKRVKQVEDRFKDTKDADIPVPHFWGGLRVKPRSIEFWQGRDSRLHDRFRYTREGATSSQWKLERLSP